MNLFVFNPQFLIIFIRYSCINLSKLDYLFALYVSFVKRFMYNFVNPPQRRVLNENASNYCTFISSSAPFCKFLIFCKFAEKLKNETTSYFAILLISNKRFIFSCFVRILFLSFQSSFYHRGWNEHHKNAH